MPDAFEGLGSPTFYFYPPLVFWLAGAFGAALPTLSAVNLTGFTLLLLSGLAMRLWLREIGGHPIGAALYMLAPYHLYDFYVRGALAEFGAYVWFPLIALGIHRRRPSLIALSYAGLILTHLPSAVLASVFLIAPIALRTSLRPVVIGISGGLALAAAYLLPALSLQSYVSIDALWSEFYRPANWAAWRYLSDPVYVSIQLLTALGLSVAVFFSRSFWALMTICCAAMALCLLPFFWSLPLLDRVQFPWRLLSVVEFAAVTAVCLRPPPKLTAAISLAILAAPFTCLVSLTMAGAKIPVAAAEAPPEYLPKGVDLSSVTSQQRDVDLSRYRGLPRGDAIVVDRPGTYAFARFAFPIWKIEGQLPAKVLTFRADRPGIYRIERRYIWQEIVGSTVSILTAILLFFGFVWSRRPLVRVALFTSARRKPGSGR
jgi:hypothetical protein